MNGLLIATWLGVGLLHLGLPLTYFAAMKRASAKKHNYKLTPNSTDRPLVTVLIPTYNEAAVIERKVRNIAEGDYPKDRLQVILVDGGSTDGTPGLARELLRQNLLNGEVLEEGERRGKALGLNSGLQHATGELVCISDAECQWETSALANAVKYFSDPLVGSVSGIHQIRTEKSTSSTRAEDSYRSVYRVLRIAESKIDSTPIAEGELQLFRRADLTGFDPTVGGDDTDAALTMVSRGLRAISAEDVVFFEPTPLGWRSRFKQKIRRGQHVLQAFLKHKGLLFTRKSSFSRLIFPMEFFLYVVNPVIFIPFAILTFWVAFTTPLVMYLVAVGLLATVLIPGLRRSGGTYLSNNLTMIGALMNEVRGEKQLKWEKIEDTRLRAGSVAAAKLEQQHQGFARASLQA